jgi:hypothetical protein
MENKFKDEFMEHLKHTLQSASEVLSMDNLSEEVYQTVEDLLTCTVTCMKARRMRYRGELPSPPTLPGQ